MQFIDLFILKALQVILTKLPIDLNHLLELITITFRSLCHLLALLLIVSIHVFRVNVLLKATARRTTLASPFSTSVATSGRIFILQLTLGNTCLHLLIDDAFPIWSEHKSLSIHSNGIAMTLCHNEVSILVEAAWDAYTIDEHIHLILRYFTRFFHLSLLLPLR